MSFTYTKSASFPFQADRGIVFRRAFGGIAATGIGTIAAVAFIPKDPEPAGSLFVPALVMSAGLMLVPMAAAIRHRKSLLRGEHLLALSPIYWLLLDLLQGAYSMDKIDPEEISKAFIGIGLFIAMVWLGTVNRPWRFPSGIIRSVSQDFSPNIYFVLAVASFFLGMLKFAIPCNFNVVEMFRYVGEARWSAPWTRGQLGGSDAFLDHLQYFGYLVPILAIVVSRRIGWRSPQTLICVALAMIMTLFLAQSGSRRVIGVVFGMALVLWVHSQQHLRFRHAIVFTVAVVSLLAALQIMIAYRNVGLAVFLEGGDEKEVQQQQYIHVDDNFYRLCQVIQLIPNYYAYVYHKYVVYVLVRPIPRVLWEGKPADPGFDLTTALGGEGVSYSYSVVGELYMSLGFLGVALGGWFYGRLAAMVNGLLAQCKTFGALVIYSILVMALFSGMRSILELILVSYAMLAWVGLSRVFTNLQRRAQ